MILTPADPELQELCRRLRDLSEGLARDGAWPIEQLRLCGEYGVFSWFLSRASGGLGWSPGEIVGGYLALSSACLTTAFVLTQRSGACRRIEATDNNRLRSRLLPGLLSGRSFATLGLSHLTTSRRHLLRPALSAEETRGGFLLNGYSPWVTGAAHADTVVTGATLPDGRDLLVALPTGTDGVTAPPPACLTALTASHTGPINCQDVEVGREQILAGPAPDLMQGKSGAATGGHATSALALGLADSAIQFSEGEAVQRPEFSSPVRALREEWTALRDGLLSAAAGNSGLSSTRIRSRANSLVLRATQAALALAKGTGYAGGHPAGRWCREALFFLVWSCPPPVMAANLRELAGLSAEEGTG